MIFIFAILIVFLLLCGQINEKTNLVIIPDFNSVVLPEFFDWEHNGFRYDMCDNKRLHCYSSPNKYGHGSSNNYGYMDRNNSIRGSRKRSFGDIRFSLRPAVAIGCIS